MSITWGSGTGNTVLLYVFGIIALLVLIASQVQTER